MPQGPTAEIKDGTLTIKLPVHTPVVSSTGKTCSIAGTGGFTLATTDPATGKPVKISVNTTTPR